MRHALHAEAASRPAVATIMFLAFLGIVAVAGVARASLLIKEQAWNSIPQRPYSQDHVRSYAEDVLRVKMFTGQEKAVRAQGSGVVPAAARIVESGFWSNELHREPGDAGNPAAAECVARAPPVSPDGASEYLDA